MTSAHCDKSPLKEITLKTKEAIASRKKVCQLALIL
jgi:hypothetical protein